MEGQPASPKINAAFVDVRDVADLHLRAMVYPAAIGERFLAIAGESMWMVDVAKVLCESMGAAADKVSTRVMPNWLVKLAALRDPTLKAIVPILGVNMNASSEKAKRLLGRAPRSREDAIVASGESLVRLGLIETND